MDDLSFFLNLIDVILQSYIVAIFFEILALGTNITKNKQGKTFQVFWAIFGWVMVPLAKSILK